ncbi:glycoside hydrolase family 97 protein [Sunxiuqinia indica]|uniref:glycoside hydrolase family 97 protein n=1 Tax=Sunxiuqinia indica TaxID=2692584 RepID=UPI0013586F50|nr:glycoside hydrolase family 97 protein [Sunxiuqinia indica]
MKLKGLMIFLAFVMFCLTGNAKNYEVKSPDGKIKIIVDTEEQIVWSITMDGKQILNQSAIALQLEEETLDNSPRLIKSSVKEINETTQAVVPYKFKNVVDHCNELSLKFKGDFVLRFRAYNNGAAYRIELSRKGEVKVKNEVCEFNFPANCSVLFPEEEELISHHEALYIDTLLAGINDQRYCDLPVLVNNGDGIKIGITETGLSDFPEMYLKGTGRNALTALFQKLPLKIERLNDRFTSEKIVENAPYIAQTSGERTFPWRCLMFAREDKELIENNLPYILAEKCVLEDVSWIKPGKAAWEWWTACNVFNVDFKSGINTETYKYYIDFASDYGLEYIVMDGRWSDYVKLDQPNADVNIREIISYGKNKGVGLIVWAHWRPLVDKLQEYLDLYQKWGVVGLKVDFMIRSDQQMVNYYEEIAAAAAERKLLVDFHGSFKPSGLQRKYPNVVNFEGVIGGEHNKWSDSVTPAHNLTIPFTRMLAGPMDYTPGAMINETTSGFRDNNDIPMSQGTRCHQVAMYVVYEAPLQMLCDNASHYLAEPKFTRFISQIPTTWDETIALAGRVKEYLVVARRNGDKWYVGGMTNWTERELEVDVGFLGEGDWEIQCVSDGVNADRYPSDYLLGMGKLENKKLKIRMAPGGGYAAILRKCDK